MTRRFKVGDKVRVKAGLDPTKLRSTGPSFDTGMDDLIGTEMTVTSVDTFGGEPSVNAKYYHWLEAWLEPADTSAPVTDDGVEAIRSAIRDAITAATPATLIPVAEALGMRVRETITYSLVPRS